MSCYSRLVVRFPKTKWAERQRRGSFTRCVESNSLAAIGGALLGLKVAHYCSKKWPLVLLRSEIKLRQWGQVYVRVCEHMRMHYVIRRKG